MEFIKSLFALVKQHFIYKNTICVTVGHSRNINVAAFRGFIPWMSPPRLCLRSNERVVIMQPTPTLNLIGHSYTYDICPSLVALIMPDTQISVFLNFSNFAKFQSANCSVRLNLYIKCLCSSNSKRFPYKNLYEIKFTLYNIL